MATVLTGLGALFTGGSAAAGAGAAAATGAAATAASGISLATILQGTATVLGVIASIGAGRAEQERYDAEAEKIEAQAVDAEREVPLETLQGVSRRTSIKAALAQQLGDEGVAYGASGLDLSFGTAAQARSEAIRDADTALIADIGTQETRQSQLVERAAQYRYGSKQARLAGVRARQAGLVNGLIGGISGVAGILGRG
jgi:hypothetical protein